MIEKLRLGYGLSSIVYRPSSMVHLLWLVLPHEKEQLLMKNPPPATFGQLRPPNNNYTYFEDKNALPFRDKASAFDKVNSGWLADFAMLAYGSEKFIQDHLDDSGLSADGFQMKFVSV